MGKKIYIGSAVAIAPEVFKSLIFDLRLLLEKNGYEVLKYIGDAPATAREVYLHDLHCVLASDIFLAECTYPSTGLGYEIATALVKGKKVIALAQEGEKVSRMVQGIDHENFTFTYYKSFDDVITVLNSE